MKKEIAKILIDLSKLIFAGVILAGLMRQDISLRDITDLVRY